MSDKMTPICVDMDGTLLRTDTLWESLLRLMSRNPLRIFSLLRRLFSGKAAFKRYVADRVSIDAATLPKHPRFVEYLQAQKEAGRPVYLATAADAQIAREVVANLPIFDGYFASDGRVNLSGRRKAAALVERFGEKGFCYAGNDRRDFDVWRHAQSGIVVAANAAVERKARQLTDVETTFPGERANLLIRLIKGIRVYQWVKNVLIFVPLVLAHKLADSAAVVDTVLAFFAFSLCASGVYVINDLLDIDNDRRHPEKRHRQFASGSLPISYGFALVPVLFLASAALALSVSLEVFGIIAGYLVLTTAYSAYIKTKAIADVVVLAFLYTARVIAGTFAIGTAMSFWLLTFSFFMFFSLSIIKRFSELYAERKDEKEYSLGRAYNASDIQVISNIGMTSGFLSLLIFALYIHDPANAEKYDNPQWLWVIMPALLYWFSRIWFKAHRGEVKGDPIVFTLRDKISYVVALFCAVGYFLAV